MMTDEGPCLVEMNCRAHGLGGTWRSLCNGLTGGHSQIETTANAYLDPLEFAETPSLPPSPFKMSGLEVTLVSYANGKVKSTPGFDIIKKLPSFIHLDTGIEKGSMVVPSIDLMTVLGTVILMHKDADVVKRDVDFIRHLEEVNGIFMYESKVDKYNVEGVSLSQ